MTYKPTQHGGMKEDGTPDGRTKSHTERKTQYMLTTSSDPSNTLL